MYQYQNDLQSLQLGDYQAGQLQTWGGQGYEDSRILLGGLWRCFGCAGCGGCAGCVGCAGCGGCGGCARCGGCGGCGRCGGCARCR